MKGGRRVEMTIVLRASTCVYGTCVATIQLIEMPEEHKKRECMCAILSKLRERNMGI